jgi:hypothetical protein
VAETTVSLPLKAVEDLLRIITELVQPALLSATERESLDIAEREVAQAKADA